jgi:hypothetical protein
MGKPLAEENDDLRQRALLKRGSNGYVAFHGAERGGLRSRRAPSGADGDKGDE